VTERITISLPDEMAEDIHAQLSYGDNRSEWIRDAIEEKLARDTATSEAHSAIDNESADSNEVADYRLNLHGSSSSDERR